MSIVIMTRDELDLELLRIWEEKKMTVLFVTHDLHEAIFLEPGLAGAKYGLSLLGRCTEDVRLPLVGLTDGTKARIKAAMEHAGLL